MKVINMFAGPGAGKSTTAAGLFYRMKKLNLDVELVTEYAKEKVWEESVATLTDQFYITSKQNRRLSRLVGKVEWVVTDSPLLLGAYYNEKYGKSRAGTSGFIVDLFNSYNNINFFIERTKPYQTKGRLGSYEDAIVADTAIKNMLKGQTYHTVKDSDTILDEILTIIGVL